LWYIDDLHLKTILNNYRILRSTLPLLPNLFIHFDHCFVRYSHSYIMKLLIILYYTVSKNKKIVLPIHIYHFAQNVKHPEQHIIYFTIKIWCLILSRRSIKLLSKTQNVDNKTYYTCKLWNFITKNNQNILGKNISLKLLLDL